MMWVDSCYNPSPLSDELEEEDTDVIRTSPPNYEDKSGIRKEELEMENKINYLWLYVCLVLGVCVVVYLVRRKLKTRN